MTSGRTVLGALAGAGLLPLFAAAPAAAQNQSFVDLQAGLGYSSNPDLRIDGVGSGFARVSAYGYHGWGSERSKSSVSGYVENSSYFRRLGNRQLFSFNADNNTQVSETMRVFGNVGFSGDFGSQLSSRFFGAPATATPLDPTIPPTSVVVVNPDLAAISQRQYRVNGLVGASFVLSPRDTLTGTVGAQRVTFKSGAGLLDYYLFDTSLAFRRQVNERLSGGVRLIASRGDYTLGRSILTYGPQLTADLRLSENLELGGAIGFVRTEQDLGALGPSSNSTDLSFDASLCRNLEYDRFCGRIARRTQSAAIGTAPTSTSLTADYSRRLTARDQVQAAVSLVTNDATEELALGRQNFYSVSGSFDRRFSPRLSAGVNLVARKFTVSGPNPDADVGGSLFVRTRLGSVR
nr:hypothetical protein [uncultured Sphingomonas sp.]